MMLIALQGLLVLGLAPLLTGWIRRIKAGLQNRQGPPMLQPYYDLLKWFRREAVVSEHASWLFRSTPGLVFAATLAAAMLIPVAFTPMPAAAAGGLIAVAALFALARFFLALAGLDTGSAFGGMGASREMALAALAEPALMLAMFTVALTTRTTNLAQMAEAVLRQGAAALTPAHTLALLGLLIVVLAETGRIPVDNPDTHLELTMIHEGMLLEYSGRHLALLHWAVQVKQLLLFALTADLFFPWGLAASTAPAALLTGVITFLAKALGIGLLVGLVEMSMAKMRLLRVPQLLAGSFTLSLVALIAGRFMGVE